MPAFRYSAGIKVDLLEMDVQLTKDGQVVIFHDNTLERMCGVKKTIADFNYDELPPILIPEDLQSKPEVINDPESTKIPLFSKLLEEFPLYPMQIDVKHGKDELILKVGNMIKELKREHLTVWGSFIPSSNDICFKHFGTSIPLFFDLSRCLKAYTLWKFGLIDMMGFRETALIMPNFRFLMNTAWLKALNDRGISIIVFGSDGKGALNTPDLWEQARAAGANGICSDKPTELQKWLSVHKMKSVQ
jgi:glycerophosphoryl diester phosphodiesterase